MQGEVLRYNTSLRFLGNIIGPMLGGLIAAAAGYSAVFISTGMLLILGGAILLFTWHRQEQTEKNLSHRQH